MKYHIIYSYLQKKSLGYRLWVSLKLHDLYNCLTVKDSHCYQTSAVEKIRVRLEQMLEPLGDAVYSVLLSYVTIGNNTRPLYDVIFKVRKDR